jgi:hypothetical protein
MQPAILKADIKSKSRSQKAKFKGNVKLIPKKSLIYVSQSSFFTVFEVSYC